MTYAIGACDDIMPSGRLRRSRRRSLPILPALVGLAGSGCIAAFILDRTPVPAPSAVVSAGSVPIKATAAIKPGLVALTGPGLALAFSTAPLGQGAPLSAQFLASAGPAVVEAAGDEPASDEQVVAEAPAPVPPARPTDDEAILPPTSPVSPLVAEIPLPVPRPTGLFEQASSGPVRAPSRVVSRMAPAAAPPTDTRSTFEKLFGLSQPSASSGPVLAYAAPEDGVVSRMFGSALSGTPDRQTAVYDISAHTVYLPDGTRLEAHSGLGSLLDDPRSMATKMRGVTPPSTYDLTLREKLFHGVRALRLTPVGNDRVFGRVGLLAHTYMLGPNGDSNGCVSFRNYDAFLQAFLSGQVKRLSVVARRA